jgi:hypothetical protein
MFFTRKNTNFKSYYESKIIYPPHFLLLFLALMLFSCTSDDLENNSTNPVINQLKNDLKLDQFSNKNISQNLVVNWETPSRIEKDGFEIYEIGITETNEVKISSKIFQESLKYELIAIKKDSTVYSYFIEAFSSVHNDLFTGTIQELDNYSGTLNVFNLDGKPLGQLLAQNGVAKNHANSSELEPLKLAINLFSKLNNSGLTNKLPSCSTTYTVQVFREFYEDRYEIWKNAITNEVYTIKFLGSIYIKTEVSFMAVAYPCESEYTNDAIHVPYITKNYSTFNCEISDVIEDNIDYTKLDPCPKGIMDKLKNTTNNDIKAILEKFGVGKVYSIEMKMGVMEYPQDFAETQKISKNNYLITVTNDSYLGATQLYKATALLHETIHAYMLSVVDDYDTYPTNAPFNDFPELFKRYVEKINGTNADYTQHEDMANKYVDAIASSLDEFQNTDFLNFISDKQVFIDMAWSGLQGTDAFNKKYPVGSGDRKRFENRFSAELIGANYGGQNVIGRPCN